MRRLTRTLGAIFLCLLPRLASAAWVMPALEVSGEASFAQIGNKSEAVARRALHGGRGTIVPQLVFGARSFSLGGFFTGMMLSQSSTSDDLAQTNLSGNGYVAGAHVAFGYNRINMAFEWAVVQSYQLKASNPFGQKESFSKPFGWNVQLAYSVIPGVGLLVAYGESSLRSGVIGKETIDLSADPLTIAQLGVGLSVIFPRFVPGK